MTFPDTQTGNREKITLWASPDAINWIKIVKLMDFNAVYGYSNVASHGNIIGAVFETEEEICVIDISSFRDAIINKHN